MSCLVERGRLYDVRIAERPDWHRRLGHRYLLARQPRRQFRSHQSGDRAEGLSHVDEFDDQGGLSVNYRRVPVLPDAVPDLSLGNGECGDAASFANGRSYWD